ncbi:MAG: TetR family transcriptional regulator [Streptosporangiales bacterium]|nr:TetR family transcriptional regulator [Streptosporangiales bacterium]
MTRQGGRAARGPGRRPGAPDTRGSILDVARQSFADHGYDATTLRGVARAAGVDPALVHHYFAGKHQLFLAAMDLSVDPEVLVSQVLDGDLADIGDRLVRTFLGVWGQPAHRARLTAMVRATASSENVSGLMREALTHLIFDRIAARLDRPDTALRVSAVASQLMGLAMARYVVRIEPLASLDDDAVVRLVGPTIQRYLTADL